MKKYQTYWLTIITIICLLSLTLSVCSVIDYTFLAESFIGVVGTYIGIAVTLIIGYQIFNIIEFRDELKVQKQANDRIIENNAILQNKLKEQQNVISQYQSRLEESKNMLYSIFSYKDESDSFRAFVSMHLALRYALDSESEYINDIFSNLRTFVDTLCGRSFGLYGCMKQNGVFYINSPQHVFYMKTVKEYIDYCMTNVLEVDKRIKSHAAYNTIRFEYESIMKELMRKLEWIETNPCNVVEK